ncbi:putative F-box domain, leucine-rich repeat domain superfamily, F-box-like domain superfamily [Helianthus annuus]|nr:putative F-box domain, leucine-rich repeat domain superfamily, F-box-like domain superfamily [Helianthus annuus]
MGQSQSINGRVINRRRDNSVDHLRRSMPDEDPKELRSFLTEKDVEDEECVTVSGDISILPDACLACIFQFLSSGDRKQCSLVCRRWLEIEGQSRHRLTLNAQSELVSVVTSLFSRFDSVTKLSLKCDRRSVSIGDDGLVLISQRCRNLTRLKLRSCRKLTDIGMETFAKNCNNLKRFSCGSCAFGAKGINAVINNCSLLEELSVKRLRSVGNGGVVEPIGPGLAALSLKFICLKDLYNAQCFGPLIIGSKNLRTLKLFRCSGDWDRLLELVSDHVDGLVEVHLERLQMSDDGLVAVSHCQNLEILHILKTPDCSNLGLVSVAENCKLLRKLHIDGWKTNRINDDGLIGVSKYCVNLQELVLIGVDCTRVSLELLATNCQKLERLALCGSETVGDAEISCIAEKCTALKKLCIKSCPVSDLGMEALAGGCPNLVKVKVKKCRGVTGDGVGWLRASRESLAVNLDTTEVESQDAVSDGGQDENPAAANQIEVASNVASSSSSRSTSFKARFGVIAGRNLVSCAFRKWSSFSGGSPCH